MSCRPVRRVGAAFLALAAFSALSAAAPQPLTFQDRLRAQEAIERVYWAHRIWPGENPGRKPVFEAGASIRKKVEDYLRKSVALEKIWNRPIAPEQLQAEMNRIAAQTKSPELLRELFEGLGNDPHLVAETLARQSLADRLARNAYARDARFHGARRAEALEMLAGARGRRLAALEARGAIYGETRWILGSEPAQGASERDRIFVSKDAWERLVAELSAGRRSPLQETNENFQVTEIVEQKDGELRVALARWPKTSFDAWWGRHASLATQFEEPTYAYVLPAIAGGSCVPGTWTPTSLDVPDRRSGHSAVWTGTEMVVWGGLSEMGFTATGLRYNPAIDTWRSTSMEGAPPARSGHKAVWTGSEMIVWPGGRYDPVEDRWAPMSLEGAVYGNSATVVWTGFEMVVWTGDSGARYVPSLDQWRKVAPDPTGCCRGNHSAVWTGSEMIVWGGNAPEPPSNAPRRWSASTNTWSGGSSNGAPAVRGEHSAVWTGKEMIVWGGNRRFGPALPTGGRYDPETDRWVATPSVLAPARRAQHTAVWTGAEMIVWGGIDGSTELGTGGRYNPSLNAWAGLPVDLAPSPRSSHTAVWTGAEMVVWGGSGEHRLDTGGRYSPSSDSWTPTSVGAQVPSPRRKPTSIWTGTEMIVWGGFGQPFWVNTGGRYDPALDTWTPTSTGAGVPAGRDAHTAVWTGSEMIVWGGFEESGATQSGGRYSPAADAWTATSLVEVPEARSRHTAVWTGSEMIVWGGAKRTGGVTPSGGRYSPAVDAWTATSLAGVPEARPGHTAVWTGSEMIVWGGWSLAAGGRYSPSSDSWLPTSTSGDVPSARYNHTAIWTGSEMIIWGGLSQAGFTSTGARYAPATDSWTPTSTVAFVPSSSSGHTAVWSGREMIVWGGGSPYGAGGRYNPRTDSWTEIPEEWAVPGMEHAAIWTGSEMIVWGGSNPWGETTAGGRYCAVPAADPADFDPPTMQSFDFAPRSVDLTRSGASITCTLRATDRPAGVGSAYCAFESPVGELVLSPLSLVSGGPDTGTWQGSVGIPWDATPGVWRAHVWLYDANANARYFRPEDLAAESWPTDLEVLVLPIDAMWVDCVHGDDADAGRTPEKPKRTIRAALPCEGCQPRVPFELHILPGVCPTEGGIVLPLSATVIGAGPEDTVVQDGLVLAGTQSACRYEDEEGPCSYVIRDLSLESVTDGSDMCENSMAELTNVRVSGPVEQYCFSFGGSDRGDLVLTDSVIGSLEVGAAAGVQLRRTTVLGDVVLDGVESILATIEDCELAHLTMTDHTSAHVTRTRFHGDAGSAIRGFPWLYEVHQLTVSDSFFKGYDRHIELDCGGFDGPGCFGNVLERNTFVGAREAAIHLRGDPGAPAHTLIRGNVFFEGGVAIAALLGQGVEADRNNFDQVREALCSQHCDGSACDELVCALPSGNLAVPSGFVSAGDFHLSETSPLIDAGGQGDPAQDLDGLPRPVDGNGDGVAAFDIGAHEFQSSGKGGKALGTESTARPGGHRLQKP